MRMHISETAARGGIPGGGSNMEIKKASNLQGGGYNADFPDATLPQVRAAFERDMLARIRLGIAPRFGGAV